MGSGWGESSDASPDGEPEPIDVELVLELDDADGDLLPDENPNAAASDSETIAGEGDDRSRIGRLPRAVRVAAVLAAVVVLAVVAWPSGGRRQAMPNPTPTPSQVDADLFEVRLGETSLQQDDGADHATLGLELTNGAPTRLSVVSAELWDAVGTRIGSAAVWPARALDAQSTQLVPVTVPYSCDTFGFLPVLPITIRYSVSTPQNPNARRDYASPLPDALWNAFTQQRSARCAGNGDEIEAVAIDTTQPIGAPSDPQGFDLTFTIVAAGQSTWSLDKAFGRDQGVTITTSGLPVTVRPGQVVRVASHWHFDDCANRDSFPTVLGGLEFDAHKSGAAGKGGGGPGSSVMTELRPGLVTEMLEVACGA